MPQAVLPGGDHGYLPADQLRRQRWQLIDLFVCPAIFDRHVPALDIAGLVEPCRNAAMRPHGRWRSVR